MQIRLHLAEIGEDIWGIRQTLDEFHSYILQNKK